MTVLENSILILHVEGVVTNPIAVIGVLIIYRGGDSNREINHERNLQTHQAL